MPSLAASNTPAMATVPSVLCCSANGDGCGMLTASGANSGATCGARLVLSAHGLQSVESAAAIPVASSLPTAFASVCALLLSTACQGLLAGCAAGWPPPQSQAGLSLASFESMSASTVNVLGSPWSSVPCVKAPGACLSLSNAATGTLQQAQLAKQDIESSNEHCNSTYAAPPRRYLGCSRHTLQILALREIALLTACTAAPTCSTTTSMSL